MRTSVHRLLNAMSLKLTPWPHRMLLCQNKKMVWKEKSKIWSMTSNRKKCWKNSWQTCKTRKNFWNQSCKWWKGKMRNCKHRLRLWKLLKLEMLKNFLLRMRLSKLLNKKLWARTRRMNPWNSQVSKNQRAENPWTSQSTMRPRALNVQLSLVHQSLRRLQQLKLRCRPTC